MADEQKFPSEIVDLPSKGKCYSKDSPLRDGKIEDREIELIESAAKDAGLSKSDLTKIHSALEDGHLDDDEKKMLES